MFLGARYEDGVEPVSIRTLLSSRSPESGRRNFVRLAGQEYRFRIPLLWDRANVNGLAARIEAHQDQVGYDMPFNIPCPQPASTGPELPFDTLAEQRLADPWNAAPWNAGLTLIARRNYLCPYLASDRLVLNKNADAGATSIELRRTSASPRSIVTGRLVSFAGTSTKVHRIQTTATFPDTTTVRTITITPELRADVVIGSYIRLNPVVRVYYSEGEPLIVTHRVRIFRPPIMDVYEAV